MKGDHKLKRLTLLLAIVLLTFTILSGCSSEKPTKQTAEDKTDQKTSMANATEEGVDNMLTLSAKLGKAIEKKDSKEMKDLGEKLNKKWLSFENGVRKSAPLLYTEIEKYLTPLAAGTKITPIDQKTLSKLNQQLIDSLNKLKDHKPGEDKGKASLEQPVKEYKKYVVGQTNELVTATKAFTDAVINGQTDEAKKAYPKARTYYERIEPIAESLGELDPKIDARENDVADISKWSGFHEIEKALWVDNTTKGQAKYAEQLLSDVKDLQKKVSHLNLEPAQVIAGAVELLNEASISKITGEEERYSHIDLVDLAANVEGSKAVFDIVKAILEEQDADLAASIEQQFSALNQSLAQYKKGDSYVTYNQLNKEDTRKISQQLNALSESLSKVAKLLS